jgi:hypothetical protein
MKHRERERESERGRKSTEKNRERKAPRITSNKRGSQYFERRKTHQL